MLNEFSKKEAPIQGLAGMGGGVPSRLLTLASGTTTYVDDVFSTFLYDGTGSAQTITNGIDLDGEGGMVWFKNRSNTNGHRIVDTERGATESLEPHDTNAEATESDGLTAFTSTGFSIGTRTHFNGSGNELCSWTFRKCPGFFDIVTYTGNGSVRTIAHNLRSVPGSIWVKRLDTTSDWRVYHRSLSSAANQLYLNANTGENSAGPVWNSTDPTSSVFTVGTDSAVNANGATYVAYLFAHNDGSFGEDSDEAVIKCGSYSGTGSAGHEINLGFEAQWIMVKRISGGTGNWEMADIMRVQPVLTGSTDGNFLRANTNGAEFTNYPIHPNPTGFTIQNFGGGTNASGSDYVYIAIRRPHKPPEAGTDVFKPELLTSASQTFNPGFAPDMNWHMFNRSSSSGFAITGARLTGNKRYLQTYSTSAESGSGSNWEYDAPTGKFTQGISSGSTGGGIEYFFKRAPGFMDMVAWSGNGSANRAISHNLNAVPELIFSKCRTNTENWMISTDDLITSAEGFFFKNSSKRTGMSAFSSVSAPTSSAFYVGSDSSINGSGRTYLAFVFASLDGISKIGTYTGTGSDGINVDCGFTAGARLVIIKRIDGTGSWYCWDSARGIVSGNDPYLKLEDGTGSGEVTNTDYIDPLNAGFTVNSGTAELNTSGGTYLFLAIA